MADADPAEVLVVDDGSDDETADVVRTICDERVRILSQANAGPGAARNQGAAAATSEILVFLDADDLLLPGAGAVFRAAHERSGADLVRTASILEEEQGDRLWTAVRSSHCYPRGNPLAGAFSVTRRAFDEVGGYDAEFRFGENSELLFRLAALLGPEAVEYVPSATGRRTTRVGRSDDHYSETRFACARRMIELHGDALRSDRETLANHHAIVSWSYRRSGERDLALRHAFSAVRSQPGVPRNWGRLVSSLLPASPQDARP